MAPEWDDSGTIRPDTHRFLLDVMLGKLAVYLRLCGYDAAYAGDRGIEADAAIRETAAAERRVLVTRDAALASSAEAAVRLTELAVDAQLAELAAAGVELAVPDEPVRCGRCNGRLAAVDDGGETPRYAPDPGETGCWRCRDCGQVFWRGSHVERMVDTIERST